MITQPHDKRMTRTKIQSLLLAAALSAFPQISSAQDSGVAFERLHLANELRNGTQLMAQLSCYIYAEFLVDEHRGLLTAAIADFQSSRDMLLNGNPQSGMAAEDDIRVLTAIGAITETWPRMQRYVDAVAAGTAPSAADMAAIDLVSLSLLEKADKLSNRIASVNGEALSDLPLILTLTVDVAGRQIVRTEQMAKEACLIATGVNAVENRANLEKTVATFSATISALHSGFPGVIMAAPTEEIRSLLEQAHEAWMTPQAVLSELAATGEISNEERLSVGEGLEAISLKFREVAALYEEIEADG